jgi:hypothetical protein
MRQHHSVHLSETSAPSHSRCPLAFFGIYFHVDIVKLISKFDLVTTFHTYLPQNCAKDIMSVIPVMVIKVDTKKDTVLQTGSLVNL